MSSSARERIDREFATRLVEEVLGRLDEPSPHVQHVSRLIVYGSYARGAFAVRDVDLAIDYDAKEALDRRAIDAATARLAAALAAVEEVSPTLRDGRGAQAGNLAADAARLRRQFIREVPPQFGYLAALRTPTPEKPGTALKDAEIARLREELEAALAQFNEAVERRLPLPPTTPAITGAGLKTLVDGLSGEDDRVSIYFHGTDMAVERGWEYVLLWERGDSLADALSRLHSIEPDPAAGRAPRSGEVGVGFEP